MIDRASAKFWSMLAALPQEVQEAAHKQFRLYKANPDHPSVNLKPLKHTKNPIWSARVNDNYRALAVRSIDAQGSTVMLWFWIGPHVEYDRMTSRL